MLTGEGDSGVKDGLLGGMAEQAREAAVSAPFVDGSPTTSVRAGAAGVTRTSRKRTLRRSVALLRAFRREQSDPDCFYGMLAADAVSLLGERLPLVGALVLDVGGGAGYLSGALRAAGAACCMIDPSLEELTWRGTAPENAVLGDGYELPCRTGGADLVVCSNMLEHVARPFAVIDELARVTRPGGHVWISFTNWYGPWGGHETSPWHYFGPDRAARRYVRRHGTPPKNRVGETMFPMHVGTTLGYVRDHPALEVLDALPRYHPEFARRVVAIPGARELLTWNLEILARRHERP
jgi:SAM-dependent methyltransferase